MLVPATGHRAISSPTSTLFANQTTSPKSSASFICLWSSPSSLLHAFFVSSSPPRDSSENSYLLMLPSSSPSVPSVDPSELRRVFQMFDRDGDGRITKKELNDSLANLGIRMPPAELAAVMERLDENGDGCVDLDEFGELYQTILGERDEEDDMREAFKVFDQNGDGFITVDELQSVLASLGLKQGRTAEDCRKMIGKVDMDGDGMVDYKEFKLMMRGGGFAALS